MICERCNQNPATVHMTDILHGGEKQEVHICEGCAEQEGVAMMPQQNVNDLIGGLMDPSVGREIRDLLEQKCPECGITYPEFRTRGRLGCAHDYEIFRKGLEPLLEKIHGNTHHEGKVPRTVGHDVEMEKSLRKLRLDLDQAVKLEEYERAAEIRDQIRALEAEEGGESHGD